jgi:hypothetical protein
LEEGELPTQVQGVCVPVVHALNDMCERLHDSQKATAVQEQQPAGRSMCKAVKLVPGCVSAVVMGCADNSK